MWIDKLRVGISNAEIALVVELQKQGVFGWLKDQQIVLDHTVPDVYFPDVKLCVYLDGEPHNTPHNQARDDRITTTLEERGYKVLRYPYKGRMSKTTVKQIVEEIREMLK